MNVSETFSKAIGIALLVVVLVACLFFIAQFVPPNQVHAQNSGVVGIYTKQVGVFTAQSTTKSSPIFPDGGFGCNSLNYQTASFSGTITIEWSPTGIAPFYVITQASYPSPITDTAYHQLPVSGYFPNMRSTVTPTAGSLSAWYTASAGPCPLISPGLGTNGASSPINCDRDAIQLVLNGVATNIGGIGPVLSGDAIIICGFTISFNGATAGGTASIIWTGNFSCGAPSGGTSWQINTTVNTPQLLIVPLQQRTPGINTTNFPCFSNGSGVSATISISYASVHGL